MDDFASEDLTRYIEQGFTTVDLRLNPWCVTVTTAHSS